MRKLLLCFGNSMKSQQTTTLPFFNKQTLFGYWLVSTKSGNTIFFSLFHWENFTTIFWPLCFASNFLTSISNCFEEFMIIPSAEVGSKYFDLSTSLFLICCNGRFPEARIFRKNLYKFSNTNALNDSTPHPWFNASSGKCDDKWVVGSGTWNVLVA